MFYFFIKLEINMLNNLVIDNLGILANNHINLSIY